MDGARCQARVVPCVMMTWHLHTRIHGKMNDMCQVVNVLGVGFFKVDFEGFEVQL
jgi:hypothetical protein